MKHLSARLHIIPIAFIFSLQILGCEVHTQGISPPIPTIPVRTSTDGPEIEVQEAVARHLGAADSNGLKPKRRRREAVDEGHTGRRQA